ncbi:hypothetical protein FHR33_004759 [Nonomuraea dietziae]|uniref:DDE Tnp4 domain-containing protein n=1 Tax=Nonomuraea dietziae TaxID=65515 RepID=A0A7W5VC65_9ACTN|nr:hypothetical protein [Nonomuraea dietziae]
MRNGDTSARLAAGFSLGTTTAWRYVPESVDLLAALSDDVHAAVTRAAQLASTILDGTLIPIDRLADQRPYYSGKHKQHGMNVRLLADLAGRLVWASPPLPGAVHDVTAARTVGLIDALTGAGVKTFTERAVRSGRYDPHAVPAASPSALIVARAAGRQPLACPWACPGSMADGMNRVLPQLPAGPGPACGDQPGAGAGGSFG